MSKKFLLWIIILLTTLLTISVLVFVFKRDSIPHFKEEYVTKADLEAALKQKTDEITDKIEQMLQQPEKGDAGQQGIPGTAGSDGNPGKNGIDGLNGVNGLSAYQIWILLGNAGNEQDFIDSLKGPQGEPGANSEPPERQCNKTKKRWEWRYYGTLSWQVEYYLPEGATCPE